MLNKMITTNKRNRYYKCVDCGRCYISPSASLVCPSCSGDLKLEGGDSLSEPGIGLVLKNDKLINYRGE